MSFKTRIQNKRDTASNWETNNPVLLDGELIVVDTNAGDIRFKIGDGTKTYTQLPFQDEVVYNALSGKADVKDLGILEGSIEALQTEFDKKLTVFDDRIVATDDGELTNVLPDMFGGHTPDEYMLKAEMPEVEKSDWSVNDENNAAYIKNRTHWTDDDGTVHKIDEKYLPDVGVRSWNDLTDKPFGETTTVKEVLAECQVEFAAANTPVNNPFSIEFVDGNTYRVMWDGVEYECDAYIAAGPNSPSIGCGAIAGASGGNDEPFFMTVYQGDVMVFASEEGTHTVSISGEGETVFPIDKKFLPSGMPFVNSSADVGQTIIVKAVDNNGMPIEWDVVDRDTPSETPLIFWDYYFNKGTSCNYTYADAWAYFQKLRACAPDGKNMPQIYYCSAYRDSKGKVSLPACTVAPLYASTYNDDIIAYFMDTITYNYVTIIKAKMDTTGTVTFENIDLPIADNGMNFDSGIILKSSTAESNKKFKITVDDSGILTATEVV